MLPCLDDLAPVVQLKMVWSAVLWLVCAARGCTVSEVPRATYYLLLTTYYLLLTTYYLLLTTYYLAPSTNAFERASKRAPAAGSVTRPRSVASSCQHSA